MKTILVDAVHAFIIEGQGIFKEMQELLDSYANPKIIVTSTNDEGIQKYGLDKVPYLVFTLKHDPEKSDPVYYQKLLKHFKLTPAEVVGFENSQEAVESARSVGIATYHYDKDKKDLVALKGFLDANT